jgi:hypothetical protein
MLGEAMNSSVIDFMDLLYRRRLATLQSVRRRSL